MLRLRAISVLLPIMFAMAPPITADPAGTDKAVAPITFVYAEERAAGPMVVLLSPDAARRREIPLPAGAAMPQRGDLHPGLPWLPYVTVALQPGTATQSGPVLHLLHLATGETVTVTALLPADYPDNLAASTALAAQVAPDLAGAPDLEMRVRAAFATGLRQRAWSPGGDYLAFGAATDGPSTDLYLLERSNAAVTRLTDGPQQIAAIQWSPDGRWIWHSYVPASDCLRCGGQAAVLVENGAIHDLYGDGGDAQLLSWIDDASYLIARRSERGGWYELRRVDLDLGESDLFWYGSFSALAVDAENDRLLLRGHMEGEPPGEGLYAMNLASGKRTVLVARGDPIPETYASRLAVPPLAPQNGAFSLTTPAPLVGDVYPSPAGWLTVTADLAVTGADGQQVVVGPAGQKADEIWWRPDADGWRTSAGYPAGFYWSSGADLFYASLNTVGALPIATHALPLGWSTTAAIAGPPALPDQPVHGASSVPAVYGWAVTADTVYVLGEDSRVYALDAATLEPRARSALLAPGATNAVHALVADDQIVAVAGLAGSSGLTQTVVLAAGDLTELVRSDLNYGLTLDPGRWLFVAGAVAVPDRPGTADWAVLAYALNDLAAAPTVVYGPMPSLGIGFAHMMVDPLHRTLLLTTFTRGDAAVDASTLLVDSDTFAVRGLLQDADRAMIYPAQSAATAGELIVPIDFHSVWRGKLLRIYTAGGEAVRDLDGLFAAAPAVADDGSRIYLPRARGLWMINRRNDQVDGIWTWQTPPAAVALSGDGEQVYLFGNGWLDHVDAAALRAQGYTGAVAVSSDWPNPSASDEQAYHFVLPGSDATCFQFFVRPQERAELFGVSQSGEVEALAPLPAAAPDGVIAVSAAPAAGDGRFLARRGGVLWQNPGVMSNPVRASDWTRYYPPLLAYAAGNDGARNIWVAAPGGEAGQQVTDGGSDEQPAWSPGWTHLAFASARTGDWEIYRVAASCDAAAPMAREQCSLQRLTAAPGDDLLPAWSPDGRWIAFVSERDGNAEIYLMDSDGANQRRLTVDDAGDWRPAWLPDSRRLVFASDRAGQSDLYLMTLAGNGAALDTIPLTGAPFDEREPAVDGAGTIYYLSDRNGEAALFALRPDSAGHHTPDIGAAVTVGAPPGVLGHPTVRSEDGSLLYTVMDAGVTRIYDQKGARVLDMPGAQIHPSGGPVLWTVPGICDALAQGRADTTPATGAAVSP